MGFWGRHFWLRTLVYSSIGLIAAVSAAALFILGEYPWGTQVTDLSTPPNLGFVSPWPASLLEEELQKQERLRKKFPRSELLRRFNEEMRRMQYLYVPVTDVLLDSSVGVDGPNPPNADLERSSFVWPTFLTKRTMGKEPFSPEVSYVVLPGTHGMHLVEGVLLRAGDRLHLGFPTTRLAKYLRFFVMAQSPAVVKVSVGQYEWEESFEPQDVNVPRPLSVRIYDASAGTVQISTIVGNAFILSGVVAQFEKTGRMPIQVAASSPLWKTPAASEGMSSFRDEDETVETESPLEPPPREEIPSSLEEFANPRVVSSLPESLALGYNVILLQMDSLPELLMRSPETLRDLMPSLAKFAETAVSLPMRTSGDPQRTFWQTVGSSRMPRFAFPTPILMGAYLSQPDSFNLYRLFRQFGFHTLALAPGPVVGLPEEVSESAEGSWLARRWAVRDDWELMRRHTEIDRITKPQEGLKAIFAEDKPPPGEPLLPEHWGSISRLLGHVAGAQLPDWHANEIFVPRLGGTYLPSTVQFMQNWLVRHAQSRFLAHVYLGPRGVGARPTLQDALSAARMGVRLRDNAFFLPQDVASEVLVDRAFGQILDSLVAARLRHRTIIAVAIPGAASSDGLVVPGSFLFSVPGLQGKSIADETGFSLEDMVATLVGTAGIPLGNNVREAVVENFPGRALEPLANLGKPALPREPESGVDESEQVEDEEDVVSEEESVLAALSNRNVAYARYHLAVAPGATGCEPFAWHSDTPVFSVSANVAFFEQLGDHTLRIYPCSLQEPVMVLSWYQELAERAASQDLPFGGRLVFPEKPTASLPIFLFGRRSRDIFDPLFFRTPSRFDADAVLTDWHDERLGIDVPRLRSQLRLANLALGADKQTVALFWRTHVAHGD